MSVPPPNAVRSPSPEPYCYQPLVIVLTAAAAGILADRFWPLSLGTWWILAAGGLTLWLATLLWRQLHCRRASIKTASSNLVLLLAVAATAGAWHHCRWRLFAADDLGRYARRKAQPVCVEAVAAGSPRALPPAAPDPLRMMPQSDAWWFDVDLVSLRDGAAWRPVSGRARLLVQGRPSRIEAGDRLRCFGRLSAPSGPQNPGAFDRAAYLRADRALSRLQVKAAECLSVVEAGSVWNVFRLLERVRTHSNQMLERYLDPRQAELAAAVLLGLREELDAGRNEAFLVTGTIHILCISGLHVGILAGALFWIMRRMSLPRGWALLAVAAITLFYALLVDAQPSVVRATILVLVACGALYLGRSAIGFNSLAAAALVVLALNPAHLFHVGAQLSFLCVAGLIWFAARRLHGDDEPERTLERLIMQNLGWLPRMMRSLRRAVIGITLAGGVLWLLTLPLVMARFHIFSLVAIILNAPLWPLMSLSVLSGFGVLVFGTICPPLAYLCGGLCNMSFWLLEYSIDLAQRAPHFWLPGPADWWLWGFYGGLGLLYAFPRIRPPRRWCAVLLAGWIAVGLTAAAWRRDGDRLDCTFLSMGHGCAVLLEFPSGRTMLYDAGQLGSPVTGVRAISRFLWSRGVTRLDAVVLSHADVDHYNALPGLLEKFSVATVYVSPLMFEKESYAVGVLREAIESRGVPVREVWAGDCLPSGPRCRVEVLHPPRRGVVGSDNANSLVLAVEYLDRRILLSGDLEPPGLDDLLAEAPMRYDVLLAPHHGSRKSNSPELAAWCWPRWVIFSSDGRWNLPEVEAFYRAIGGQVMATSNRGAIHVRIAADGVRVTGFVEPR